LWSIHGSWIKEGGYVCGIFTGAGIRKEATFVEYPRELE
jgi:hypothetical protein